MARTSHAWAICLALAAGCGPTLGVRQRIANHAKQAFRCGDPPIVTQLAADAFEVRACGEMLEYTRNRAREFRPMEQAAAIASRDLRCPIGELEPVPNAARPAFRALRGCGQTALYQLTCSPESGCEWRQAGIGSLLPGDTALPAAPGASANPSAPQGAATPWQTAPPARVPPAAAPSSIELAPIAVPASPTPGARQ